MDFNFDKKLNEHLDVVVEHFPENEFFYIGLYGSQNYGLATAASDVDTKCMIIPTPREVILGKSKVSCDLTIPSDGALCNVKDIREMFNNFFKGNINFVEILYTEWALESGLYLEEAIALRDNRDLIANRDPYHLLCMAAAMARQKYIAFDKPFESKRDILAKYSFDPKQLHHLIRFYHFMKDYMEDGDFKSALRPSVGIREALLDIKTNPPSYENAKQLREEYMERINSIIDSEAAAYKRSAEAQAKTDAEVREFLDDLACKVITKSMKSNLLL